MCAIATALAPHPTLAQLPFEIVQRGQVDPAVVQAVQQATLRSLASLARLGVVLDGPVKAYLCATKADYADVLVEFGLFDRPTAERRSHVYSGQSALGAFALNLEYIRSYTARPDLQVWWTVPHEMFHLYQRQSQMDRRRTPFAFWEGPAELHKLKVLDERRVIDFQAYVKATLLPRSQQARKNHPAFSIRQIGIGTPEARTLGDFYRIAAALGIYLHETAGWPKIIALYAPGDTRFSAQFEAVFGRPVEEFERDFFAWLDRQ
ncbi:MAG: hypothetical protein QN131_09065 [Armatimonadota bacterium]|nr:hypothetical protein [Armatimonadota bacterium]MDR7550069.1 hypothetical protein [Armatimonadota bacterium]